MAYHSHYLYTHLYLKGLIFDFFGNSCKNIRCHYFYRFTPKGTNNNEKRTQKSLPEMPAGVNLPLVQICVVSDVMLTEPGNVSVESVTNGLGDITNQTVNL